MNIIIMGAGKVGEVLCRDLSFEDHNITLIEKDKDKLEEMLNEFDINGLYGNGASHEIQIEAGVENVDIFIAVTDNDELNMISCVLAGTLGAKHTIARVRKEEYSNLSGMIKDSLGLSYVLNPEYQSAEYIRSLIAFPQALSYESFTTKEAPIVEMKVEETSDLIDKELWEFRNIYKNLIVCAVSKNNEVFIPNGDYKITLGVHLYVTGSYKELVKLFADNGQVKKKINSMLIIGGGLITRYILRVFEKTNIKIKVIELDRQRAEELSESFPNIDIINDDGTSLKNLEEQGLKNYDAFLALTGIDEENIIVTMIAKKIGMKKTLTKISRTELNDLKDIVGLDSIITPKRIVADIIIQKVRALYNSQGSNVEALYTIANDQVEALQFKVKKDSKITKKAIKDLPIKKGNLIAFIVRNGKVLFPTGNDIIKGHDRVILITQNTKLNDLDEILL